MHNTPLDIFSSERARDYIRTLPYEDQTKIKAGIETLAKGDFESIKTKPLRHPVREIVIGTHRIIYFVISSTLCILDAFRKTTQKTPKKRIDYALTIYKEYLQHFNK